MLRYSLFLALLASAYPAAATPAPPQARDANASVVEIEHQEAVVQWRSLDSRIQPALNSEGLDRAIEAAKAALTWADERIGEESAFAVLSVDKLRVLLDLADRYEESEPLHRRALLARKRTLGDDAPETLTELNNLGAWYLAHGRLSEGEELLSKAVEGRTRIFGERSADTAISMNNLAAVMTRLGHLDRAEPLLLRLLELQDKLDGLSDEDAMLALANLAVVYREQRRYGEAAVMLERVRAWRTANLGPDHPDTIAVLSDLGAIYADAGLLLTAEPLMEAALAVRTEKLGPDNPATLDTANNIAGLYRKTGRAAKAEVLLDHVFEVRRRSLGELHPRTLSALNNLGATRFATGDANSAELLLGSALDGLSSTLGAAHPDTIEAAANLAIVNLSTGRKGSAALQASRLVVAGLRERRANSLGDRFSESGLDRERRTFARYFGLLANAVWQVRADADATVRRKLDDEAFQSLQEASFERTSKGVARMAALRAIGDGDALRTLLNDRERLDLRWREQQSMIAGTFGRLDSQAEAERTRLGTEKTALESDIAALDREIAERFPRYSEFVDPHPLSIVELQSLLRPDEAVVLTVPTEFGTHVFAITSDTYRWHRASRDAASVDSAVRQLRWDAGAEVEVSAQEVGRWLDDADDVLSFDRTTAWELYRDILEPVTSTIESAANLIISASGSLAGLPLGVLVTTPPIGRDSDPDALRQSSWLADKFAMTQVPSLSSVRLLRRFARSEVTPPTRLLAIGAPVLMSGVPTSSATGVRSTNDADVPSLSIPERIGRLAPIPAAAIELRAMRRLLGVDRSVLLLGDEATETALRDTNLSSFTVLAFATHGLMAGDLTPYAEPGLILTPISQAPDEDGFLSAPEIAQLDLNAEFVLLSACNTAAGDSYDNAEGLSGLTRAFFYAGAKNLLVSHWPLLDEVAPRLTVRLLELMTNDPRVSSAQALKQAMKEVRDDPHSDAVGETWAHPAVWAAFSVVGDGS